MAKVPSFGDELSKAKDDLTNQMSETEILDDQCNGGMSSNCFPSTSGKGNVRNDDEDTNIKEWLNSILNQVKSVTAAIAVPINQVITIFEGDPGKFKQWIKDIEKYAKMSDMNNEDIPKIAYVTCKGSVGDFIKRYLTEIEASGELPSWNDLKQFLKYRFAEITDSQHALAIMRKMRQNSNVQIFAERILQVAEDTYTSEIWTLKLFKNSGYTFLLMGYHLIFLRMKVLRENSNTLENAVQVAMREQNLRKRFALRSQDKGGDMSFNQNSTSTVGNNFLLKFFEIKSNIFRREEPMEIDHFRNQRCHRCRKIGHRAKFCPFSSFSKQIKS